MGRELRRVPLDFNWPLNKVWGGYINPHYKRCPDCENGYSEAGDWLREITQTIMWRANLKDPEVKALTSGLAGREPFGPIGHDSCDQWAAFRAIVKAAGIEDVKGWGTCKTCGGTAQDPSTKEACEKWEDEDHDPPEGPGYQLWETTSEGSPISPVFESLEALCEWAEKNASTFADHKATKEQWMKMLGGDEVFVKHEGKLPDGSTIIFI